jgi:hypothetical protein
MLAGSSKILKAEHDMTTSLCFIQNGNAAIYAAQSGGREMGEPTR